MICNLTVDVNDIMSVKFNVKARETYIRNKYNRNIKHVHY